MTGVLIDNYNNGKVGDFLKNEIQKKSKVSIVSAYFTIYAYKYLKDNLNFVDELRFLFGEPTFIKNMNDKTNPRDFKIEDDKLVTTTENTLSQKKVAKDCSDWIKQDKIKIKSMIKPNFLHGKLYYIEQLSGKEKALLGSSNFTVSGLGLGKTKNIELNTIIDSDRDKTEIKEWFEQIWNNNDITEDVKESVLKYLEQLYEENSPEFIYFKTLYHVFEKYLNEQKEGELLNAKTGFYDSEIWNKLFDFQKDGVKGVINKILKHNGCIIADSVGLGKTYEALAVIKYFESLNARVLVICPKKLRKNWTIYQANQNNLLNPFVKDRFNYSVVYHTDIGREKGKSDANNIDLINFNWSVFDLIVIDESHNFRGNQTEKTNNDGSVKMNRSKWLMEKIIKTGVKTKVLLLSATPVNNTLKDLRNQISYITENNDNALSESSNIQSIKNTLETAQKNFTSWNGKNAKQFLESLDSSFFKLLDELTIARSRKHITEFYEDSNIKFPQRNKPVSVYSDIDTNNKFPSYDEINKKISEYQLSLFNPSKYLKEGIVIKADEKTNFKQKDREYYLIGMMKVNFLKRLESSIISFKLTLENTIKKIEILEEKIKDFKKLKEVVTEENVNNLIPNEEAEENESTEELWEVGKKLKFKLIDLKIDDWLNDLANDKKTLTDILILAKEITSERDGKLKTLKETIKDKIKNNLNTNNKKIVIFTAFADTAKYLYENTASWVTTNFNLHSALICGNETKTTFGINDYDNILTNFSPISKSRKIDKDKSEKEIDILIATDCISEGQNLQDCDCVINYDIHWNPVRIIQRFGRIDRLGSKNEKIKMINFWPTDKLDKYINLELKVKKRMALVDVTATNDDNILNPIEIEELIREDLTYRAKQLGKLKEEVLDLEEIDDNISFTDFTLDDFRIDLSNYININKEKLKKSPLGLYAVIPSPESNFKNTNKNFTNIEKDIIKPGVIFCLSLKENSLKLADFNEYNQLNPFFLVYVRDDGTVRYNFTNSKRILEIFRTLCRII